MKLPITPPRPPISEVPPMATEANMNSRKVSLTLGSPEPISALKQ